MHRRAFEVPGADVEPLGVGDVSVIRGLAKGEGDLPSSPERASTVELPVAGQAPRSRGGTGPGRRAGIVYGNSDQCIERGTYMAHIQVPVVCDQVAVL